jgi:hypothetical protein
MELFLNLCWLSLLMPAYWLWRRETDRGADRPESGLWRRHLVSIGVLGSALILLFPVVSATDDMHAMRPALEESENAVRDAGRSSCGPIAIHPCQADLSRLVSHQPEFEPINTVLALTERARRSHSTAALAERAPPTERSLGL